MNPEMFRRITETSYLTAQNAGRYRSIMRYCYLQHERMNHYVKAEEIYEVVSRYSVFQDNSFDDLLRDLDNLREWGNLSVRQDTGRVHSIEEFKKKRFQYSCTPYTVEIERMVQRLENIGDSFGGSLEKTRFERLYDRLIAFVNSPQVQTYPEEELYQDWEEILDLFNKIWQNATDYTASLEGESIKDLTETESFLIYKDTFVSYLKNFIISLQNIQPKLQKVLYETEKSWEIICFERIAKHEQKQKLSNNEGQEGLATERDKLIDQYHSLQRWFLGKGKEKSEAAILEEITNEAIRRVTKMVQRLSDRSHQFRSRKQDYLRIAEWFHEAETLEEAKEIYSKLFGLDHTQHYYGVADKTENIMNDVWDDMPEVIGLKGTNRQTSRNTRTRGVQTKREDKQNERQLYLKQMERSKELLEELFVEDRFELKEGTRVPIEARKIFLGWLSKAQFKKETSVATVQTDFGYQISIERMPGRYVKIESEDGNLQLPAFQFVKVGKLDGK